MENQLSENERRVRNLVRSDATLQMMDLVDGDMANVILQNLEQLHDLDAVIATIVAVLSGVIGNNVGPEEINDTLERSLQSVKEISKSISRLETH